MKISVNGLLTINKAIISVYKPFTKHALVEFDTKLSYF